MKKIIFATHNQGKLKEMKSILKGLPVEVLSATEAGIIEEIEETGTTCQENSLIKSRYVAKKTGEWAIADDTGLCIDALGGKPGVYSARWTDGAPHADFTLEKMKGIENRNSYFLSIASLVKPNGEEHVFEGKINGTITTEKRGVDRPKLPYDLIFQPEGYNETFAEMSDDQKNSLSHRGKAFQQMRQFIEAELKLLTAKN
ncbi:RdgB/HAM1 family non-canonical purine NTP pyrophosphatase [Candidatus Falkowbacteria bacterium]|jgi:XTP/dITP diphosphohydrolase|nr:RdgB/HAM1 family non-canonical purine NTP pyrophosphatase [Candidatus Falkowbacteria bacterium]